ncbi:hypothetical protein BU15DRAFT_68767 [Melanogaster broomeanus]|nr:hypothetical protein BU15DRAFT_68767 [Melanogaster broomeanus]
MPSTNHSNTTGHPLPQHPIQGRNVAHRTRHWPNKHLKANAPACTTGHCGLDSTIVTTQCNHASDDATQPHNAPARALWPRQCNRDDATQPWIRQRNAAMDLTTQHSRAMPQHGCYGLDSAIVTMQRSHGSDDATQPRNAPARVPVASTTHIVVTQSSHGSDDTTCPHSRAPRPTP